MSEPFKSWAILELLGHRRLGGMVTEVELFGGRMARIDIPDTSEGAAPDKVIATQHYSQAAIYGCHPCTEEAAREAARWCQPQLPVTPLALPPRPEHTVHACPECLEDCSCGASDPPSDCQHECQPA